MESQSAAIAIAFLFSFIPLIVGPILAPQLHLFYFAPFLVLLLYKRPLVSCLWFGILCGLIVDLLSYQTQLGFNALLYCCTLVLLSRFRGTFFEDKPTTLPVMTYLFAFLTTAFTAGYLFLTSQAVRFSWTWIATDLLLMPLTDAIFAATWFALPAFLLRRRPRKDTHMVMNRVRK